MTEAEIRERLKAYRVDVAALKGIQITLSKLKRELKREEDDTREVLAGAGAAKLTGMPGAHSIESKVETAAIKMIDEPTKEMLTIREQIADAETRMTAVSERVELVDAWLDALTHEERYAVTGRVIDAKQWGRIQAEYETDAGRYVTVRTMSQWASRAMKKICVAAENVI